QFLFMSLGRQLDDPAVGSKAESVGQQVEESLPQTAFIALKGSNVLGTSEGEGEAPRLSLLAPEPSQGAQHFADVDLTWIELHVAGLDGGEIDHVVDQRRQLLG